MNHETISALGNAIDDVYSYTSEDGARKTNAKILGNNELHITYMTILNVDKQTDQMSQMSMATKEANDMISSRLKTIKSEFKNHSSLTLKTKYIKCYDNLETLTVSPYSPFRKIKFSYTCQFEIL